MSPFTDDKEEISDHTSEPVSRQLSSAWMTEVELLLDTTAAPTALNPHLQDFRDFTFLEVVSLMLMVAVTLVALAGNTSILLVIARSPQMRTQLAFLHLLNMCVIHILGCLLVLPMSMAHFGIGFWVFGESYCHAHQFFISFFSYSAIMSMCVISIERYYSIRAPMHYAVHVTLNRTLVVIIGQHLYAGLVSAIPFFISEAIRNHDWSCVPRSERLDGFYRIYIYVLGIVCFLIPAFVMLTMYSLVYKVAKQAARRVHPSGRLENNENHTATANVPTPLVASTNGGTIAPDKEFADSRGQQVPRCFIVLPPEANPASREPPEPSSGNAEASSNIHWKAIKTLFLIITAFLAFWGPHFLLKLIVAANGTPVSSQIRGVAIFFQWLGWTSFAVNPFIYGGLNRNVREEIFSQWTKLKRCFKKEELQEEEEGAMGMPGDNEDFFQFLERTTAVGAASIHPMNGSVTGEADSDESEPETVKCMKEKNLENGKRNNGVRHESV